LAHPSGFDDRQPGATIEPRIGYNRKKAISARLRIKFRQKQNDYPARRQEIANQKVPEIEILSYDDPVFGIGNGQQLTVGGAVVGFGGVAHIVAGRPQAIDNRLRAALIGEKTDHSAAMIVSWLR
jgi:hypothetical protein